MKNRILFALVFITAVTALFTACGEEETNTLGGFADIQWKGYNSAHVLKTTGNALVFTNQDGDSPPDKTWPNANLVDVPPEHDFSWEWTGENINNPNMTEQKAYYIVDKDDYIAFAVSYTLNGTKTKMILLYEAEYRGLGSFTSAGM
jgi:hypothetical protein